MTKSLYDLLGVAPTASADEIKRAFRQEIAKYHPDKVHHLGREFQEIAAVRSAELTHAYKTLTDASLRADYDAEVLGVNDPRPVVAHAPRPAPTPGGAQPPPARPQATEDPPPRRAEPRRGQDHGGVRDLVRRAALIRFRQALEAEFGSCEEMSVQGFEIACAPPKGRFWSKVPPRILARFVPQVDAGAVADSWLLASRLSRDERELCLFVMGPAVAPIGELAHAIAEQLRKPNPAGRLTLVPVNTRSWSAHIPNDAPPAAKSLAGRLKSL
jgi:hypothetical protein